MTPKEKAEELVGKFYFLVQTKEEQKRCALIAVDEIIKSYTRDYELNEKNTYWHPYDYWQQVKQEIEKL